MAIVSFRNKYQLVVKNIGQCRFTHLFLATGMRDDLLADHAPVNSALQRAQSVLIYCYKLSGVKKGKL